MKISQLFIMFSYSNLQIVRANFGSILYGLPMRKIWKLGKLKGRTFVLEDMSDVLRMALLLRSVCCNSTIVYLVHLLLIADFFNHFWLIEKLFQANSYKSFIVRFKKMQNQFIGLAEYTWTQTQLVKKACFKKEITKNSE